MAWWDLGNHIRYGVEKERALLGDDPLGEGAGLMNTIMGGITGANSEGVQSKKDAITEAANKRKYKSVIESLEGTYTPGMSVGDLDAQKRRLLKEAYAKSPEGQKQAQQLRVTEAGLKNQEGQLALQGRKLDESTAATRAQTTELGRQFDVTQANSRADSIGARADKADDRIAQLEMLEMQLAAEDRRTQEGWDRQDAKDQKEFLLLLGKSLGDLTTLFG